MEEYNINPNYDPEAKAWESALEDYMVQQPNDWIAKWLYGGVNTGMWEESMYADILRDWYGELPSGSPSDRWWGRRRGTKYGYIERDESGNIIKPRYHIMPEPAWMSELGLISERGEDIRGPFQGEEWEAAMKEKWGADWNWLPTGNWIPKEDYYLTAPGQAESLRPLGSQVNLTTEQLDQLMYYLTYTKGGKPASRKDYLETVAYKMPGWIQDYMSTSQSMWPTVSPPKARMTAAWQR